MTFSNAIRRAVRGHRDAEAEITTRYARAIAVWSRDHGCTRGDYTDAQWARYTRWDACRDEAEARAWWQQRTRAQFVRFLFITRRIGVG